MERHVRPPAKQQMMLATAQGIYSAFEKQAPQGLAQRVSLLHTDAQFKELLDDVWQDAVGDSPVHELSWETSRSTMLTSLIKSFEPRARLIDAKALRVEKQLAENRYVGIGIQVAWNEPYCEITEPFVGGAARNAGSRAGDLILEIDGRACKGKNLGQIIDELRGEEGTRVVVKVRNKNEKEARTLDMIRTTIPLATVQGVRRNDDDSWNFQLEQGIAYLRFDRIAGSSAAELRSLAAEIDRQQFDTVVLDFSRVGEADFHYALMVADLLSDQQKLGRLQTVTGSRDISTRSGRIFRDKRVVGKFRNHIDGSMLLIASALINSNGRLIGSTITSGGFVGERLEIEELGAVSFFSTGQLVPLGLPSPPSLGVDVTGHEIRATGITTIAPDASDLANLKKLIAAED